MEKIMEKNLVQSNPYDIIIKNIWGEYESMQSLAKEKWETPQYSKDKIYKAGKNIIDLHASEEDRNDALGIVNNWRASHAYPLQIICSNLRTKNPNAIVVQRLKRLKSITGKLERYPDMNLYRMQDIGGCRVIVDQIDQVFEAVDRYKNSRIRHKLMKENNYIAKPKTSGYRSYHMVYKYHSDKKETYNKNMLIEIQFRTKLQHMWATAVEMMGIYTKENLKSSRGNKNILRFFVCVSSLFAIEEHTPVCPNTSENVDDLIQEIQNINQSEQILNKLLSISMACDVTKKYFGRKNKTRYYILVLDYQSIPSHTTVYTFPNSELATKAYGNIEAQKQDNQDAVLVSAKTFSELQLAYPNYFSDIKQFTVTLRDIFIKHGYNFSIDSRK